MLTSLICEAMWMISFDWKSSELCSDSKDIFRKTIQKYSELGFLTIEDIQDQIEEDTLIEIGILSGNYVQHKNKIRTNTLYELKKFNLLREENEGFSRLISELTQTNIDVSNVDIVIENIFSLIGFFRLDPNRVIDIILDCYSFQPDNQSFDKIMNEFIDK